MQIGGFVHELTAEQDAARVRERIGVDVLAENRKPEPGTLRIETIRETFPNTAVLIEDVQTPAQSKPQAFILDSAWPVFVSAVVFSVVIGIASEITRRIKNRRRKQP